MTYKKKLMKDLIFKYMTNFKLDILLLPIWSQNQLVQLPFTPRTFCLLWLLGGGTDKKIKFFSDLKMLLKVHGKFHKRL